MSDPAVSVVHAADIHLDSPLRGLGRLADEDLVHRLRSATRSAFDNLVDHCIATRPAALLLAGDLYDGDWRDYSTGVHFVARMRDLADVAVPVILVQGNHDAESVISRSLTLPPNVTRLGTDGPETRHLEDAGLAVHGQGFATKAVSTNLAAGYPPAIRGMINIGILHTSVQGYSHHDPYAPCSVADLTGRGYAYFALGHVHARQVLATGRTTVAFSGNLQGRHIRETGPKGALEVRLRPDAEADLTFLPLDVARWHLVTVDVGAARDEAAAYDLVDTEIGRVREEAGTRPVVTRIRLVGVSPLAGRLADAERVGHELRPRAARHEVAVDRIVSDIVAPPDRRQLPATQRAALEAVTSTLCTDPSALFTDPSFKTDLDALCAEVNDYTRDTGTDLAAPEQFTELVTEACRRLLAQADGGLL